MSSQIAAIFFASYELLACYRSQLFRHRDGTGLSSKSRSQFYLAIDWPCWRVFRLQYVAGLYACYIAEIIVTDPLSLYLVWTIDDIRASFVALEKTS